MGCDAASSTTRAQSGGSCSGPGGVVVEQRDKFSVFCSWRIGGYSKIRQRAIWSNYFEVGGYDCRLLIYPGGDSQAVPGYTSIYLQLTDPRHSGGKWECFASYQLSIVNQRDISKSITRDSWHRYSAKKKSHGWCDFAPACTVTDPLQGFTSEDTLMITADITILNETCKFSREDDSSLSTSSHVVSGTFNWRVHNFSQFMDMIKTQKIMSPIFPAGGCCLQISVYQLTVEGVDYLSLCLESKDPDKSEVGERTCWCLFRISVMNQNSGRPHKHRDSYGRFTADGETGDSTSLGWNEYMKMSDFMHEDNGYLIDNTAVFQATYHVLMEQSSFSRLLDRSAGHSAKRKGNFGGDHYQGKFVWKIENFTKLKEMLRKRKITGLCIKSRRFQVGGKDCRLIVYPRGQSQPPSSLSMFLEVTKRGNVEENWSCFVSHRLSVLSQGSRSGVERTVVKESQNRYSKTAKDWGWREFISLTSLFDQELGFLVNDGISFQAEVLVLKETFENRDPASLPGIQNVEDDLPVVAGVGRRSNAGFVWRMDNFAAFREVMETRKIYSQYFKVGECSLRIGMYDSFDMLCVYLESEHSSTEPEENFWVRFRIAVVNQKNPSQTVWKQSSLCTRTWSTSVLQLIKVSELTDSRAGYLHREGIQVACHIIDWSSWFDFGDSDLTISEEVASTEEVGSSFRTALTTVNDVSDAESSEQNSKSDVEEMFQSVLSGGQGFGGSEVLVPVMDGTDLQETLQEKIVGDAGSVSAFISGLRSCLTDPAKVRRLVMPTQGGNSASLLELLLNIQGLTTPLLDMLLDIMVECSLNIGAHAANCAHNSPDSKPPPLESSSESQPQPDDSQSTSGQASLFGCTPWPNLLNSCLSPGDCERAASVGEALNISPMIRFGTFAPGAVPGLDQVGGRSRSVDHRAWRVLGQLGSHGLTADSSLLGEGAVRPGGSFSAPAKGSNGSVGRPGDSCCGPYSAPNSTFRFNSSVPENSGKTEDGERVNAVGDSNAASGSGGNVQQPNNRAVHAELLAMLLGALSTADFVQEDMDREEGPSGSDSSKGEVDKEGGGYGSCWGTNLQKIRLLLSAAPLNLFPDIIMLIPLLLKNSEHTAAADLLWGLLGEVGRRSPEMEQILRPAVLCALGPLKISSEVAGKVVEAALEGLPSCHVTEVPAAVVLILKLSSEHSATKPGPVNEGVRGVRTFLRENGGGLSENKLVAVQLAIVRHPQICDALVADINKECDSIKSQKQIGEGANKGTSPGPSNLIDTMVLLELLRTNEQPAEVQKTIEKCIATGLITSADMTSVIDRRKMHQRFWRDVESPPNPDEKDGSWVSEGSTGSEEEAASTQFPVSNDVFQALVSFFEQLLKSKDARVRAFLVDMYHFMFGLGLENGMQNRLLQTLVPVMGKGEQEGSATSLQLPDPELLLGVVKKFPPCGSGSVSLLIDTVESQAKDVNSIGKKVSMLEEDKCRLDTKVKDLSTKTRRERKDLRTKISDLEGRIERMTREKQVEAKKTIAEKTELQDRVRKLGGQLDWLQAERSEEQNRCAQSSSALEDAQRQVRDSEALVADLRKQRRDEGISFNRERTSLNERIVTMDNEKKRLEGVVGRLKQDGAQQSKRVHAAEEKVKEVQQMYEEREAEVAELRTTVESHIAANQEHQDFSTRIQSELQEKSQRCSKLEGNGLDELEISDLQELLSVSTQTCNKINDILQRRAGIPASSLVQETSSSVLGLVRNDVGSSSLLPTGGGWDSSFQDASMARRSVMYRSGSDVNAYMNDRLSAFSGVLPRDGPGQLSNSVMNGVSKPVLGLDMPGQIKPDFGDDAVYTSGPARYDPYPPPYHTRAHSQALSYDDRQRFVENRSNLYGFGSGGQESGWFSSQGDVAGNRADQIDRPVLGRNDHVDRPTRSGYVNGLFGSSSLINGKHIW